jgi:thioesterase domain-containing protein
MGFFFRDPHMGWSAYVKGGIDLVEVEGDHHSIFEEPGVVTLAENLNRVMQQSGT